jgi:hypothetical protein
MVFKTCQKCGKKNPRFFTHCIYCDAPLVDKPLHIGNILAYLKIALVLCVSVLLIMYVIIPGVQYSGIFVQNFSETVSAKSVAGSPPVAEYPLNRPAVHNNLRVTVISAHDGQNTYNYNKFFLVSIQLENIQTEGNIRISSSDFELIDSEGLKYLPYGIGSQVTHTLNPHQGISTQLIFVIPQKATVKKIQFTFPGSSALTSSRKVVAFVI